ncbi:MAG: O-antigen ligase family protein [Pseudomonadota bacterium]
MFRTLKRAPFPLILLIGSFLCPTELSLEVSELRLPPHRFAILALAPFALLRVISQPDTRLRLFDILLLLYGCWSMYVYDLHSEDMRGLVYGGSIALESFGAYIIARAYIRDIESFRATLDLLVLAAMAALCFALPETIFGAHFTHDYLQQVTGYEHERRLETRLGLTRAYGTFDHPIHLGTFAAATIGLVWFSGHRLTKRIRQCGLIALTTFSALSSAPILCVMIQGAFVVWDKVTRGLKARIILTLCAIVLGYILISIVANRTPIMIIATSLTLDNWTGYYRTVIWEHGLKNVWENPWLGLGLADWKRPWWMISDSVDAYWLVVAMRTGIPAFLLLVIGLALHVGSMALRVPQMNDPRALRAMKAWLFSFIALCLIACTVHFWNAMHAYFFFFIGLAGWLSDPMRAPYLARRLAKRKGRRRRRQSRPNPAIVPTPTGALPLAPGAMLAR